MESTSDKLKTVPGLPVGKFPWYILKGLGMENFEKVSLHYITASHCTIEPLKK
jgi:hypothetical protein